MAMYIDPLVGTLTQEFVYPGMASPESPAPARATIDEATSAQGFGGLGFTANISRSALWFIAFAVLLIVLWLASGGGD